MESVSTQMSLVASAQLVLASLKHPIFTRQTMDIQIRMLTDKGTPQSSYCCFHVTYSHIYDKIKRLKQCKQVRIERFTQLAYVFSLINELIDSTR